MSERKNNEFPIEWLRHTSPYINTHRGSTFVVWVSGTHVKEETFANLVHDLTLLCHLGVRLVLVHGMRPQIDAELTVRGFCLLYTSPSPRDATLSRMPSSA